MKKLKFIRFKLYDATIDFKQGVNFIVGSNGMGKTTVFTLLKHVLGLEKNAIERNAQNFYLDTELVLETEVESKTYSFKRFLNSPIITVISNAENKVSEFKVNSKEYDSFLSSLFEPNLYINDDTGNIKDILKTFFVSETLSSIRTKTYKDRFYNVFGYNNDFLLNAKNSIYKYTERLLIDEEKNEAIKAYKDKLISKIENSDFNKNVIEELVEIIDLEFVKTHNLFLSEKQLLNESKSAFKDMSLKMDVFYKENLDQFNQLYARNLNKIGIYPINLEDLWSFKGSYGEYILYNKILYYTLLEVSFELNVPGFVVEDNMYTELDNHKISLLDELHNEMKTNDDVQFIIFSIPRKDIDKECIIFNLDKWRLFDGFEK